MLWPKKRNQPSGGEAGTPNILTILPKDLVIYMMQFLSVYQQVGLGEVSTYFRDLLREHLGYDPFAPSQEHWTSLGMVRPAKLPDPDVETLQGMADEAYKFIYQNLRSIGNVGQGVYCSTLMKLSTANHTPTGSPFIKVNCLAELKVGGETIRAVNFTTYGDQSAADKLMASLGVDVEEVNYLLVTRRHAEMRLILKLIDRPDSGSAELRIDKLCCVFCAAQLMALGYKHLIAGWAAGNLQWYTFSPITMFFTNGRAAIWGPAIERQFAGFSWDRKLEFLYLLTNQASRSSAPIPTVSSSPSMGMLQIAANDSGGAGAMVASGRASAFAIPSCPACQEPMVRRTNRTSGQRFWGCKNFPRCSGR